MIKYALRCERGHQFESWFQNSSAYDSQRKRKLVTCPVCDSSKVEKALMAPQISRQNNRKDKSGSVPAVVPDADVPVPAGPSPLAMGREAELRAKLRELREIVTKNADDVGERFPNEARKMHYGESEHRPIWGQATADEARDLIDEGIEVTPLPFLPEDKN